MKSSMPPVRHAVVLATLFAGLTTARAQEAPFTVGTASAARGSVAYGELKVPAGSDAGSTLSVAVVNGAKPGPVVAFVAGSHGTEYASIVALTRLTSRLDGRVPHLGIAALR